MANFPSDREPLLNLSNICLYYGQIRALHQINLRLHPGEVHAIVGEHGAGKSSLCLMSHRADRQQSRDFFGSPQRRVMELVFRDTGSGIQGVNPQDIFLSFYSTKSGKPGHLGLSVSYGIIAKYRGEISVKNLDTGGCQFTITLPLAEADT